MSKTLVVSDNEILNQLYVTNLEVYLATEVKLVVSTQKAIDLIQSDEEFDLIITMNMINGQDCAVALYQTLSEKNLDIPLVVIGNPVKEIPCIVVVQSSYHLKNLLRACAGLLGITPKFMAGLVVPDYYPVDIKFLMRLGVSPCQIFLQVKKNHDENNYAMIVKKGASVVEILKKFSAEGISILYVNKLDRLSVVNQVSKNICDFIKSTENMGVSEKSTALEAGFEFVASDFCRTPETAQEVMNIANACTKLMEDIGRETPGLKSLLQLLTSQKNGYIFTHSVLASFISSHIVKKVSWGGEGHMEKINFVLFFHDIMLVPIYANHPNLKYEEDLLFCDELNEKEKDIVLNHARLAAEMIITYRKAPMGADLLIKQHHGMTNGVGFAIDFKDDISPLTKIVLISEAFVEEYMKFKDRDPQFQVDLKKILPMLYEKFKKSTYRKIIDTLESINI